MVRVTFSAPHYDSQRKAVDYVVQAELIVDGHEHSSTGEVRWIDLSIPVIDPATGRQLVFEDDPEAWARLLPTAYRSGDIVLEVVEEMAPAAQHAMPAGRRH
jgi:hypothetical protein